MSEGPAVVHTLIVGGSPEARRQATEAAATGLEATVEMVDALALPFIRVGPKATAAGRPRVIHIDEIDRAFPNAQVGTRLILTQSTYTLQKWVDLLKPGDRIVATADRRALEASAPEAFQRRGPWRSFEISEITDTKDAKDTKDTKESSGSPDPVVTLLAQAFSSSSPEERLAMCQAASAVDPDSPVAALALASACREQQDMAGARQALDLAIRLAPGWEAVHYEDGKFWLAFEEMERARDAFQRASDLMPTFSASFSNLGATLGELDQQEAALAAFMHASSSDPDNFMLLNNIGVVTRELGRRDESEVVLRRLVTGHPEFIFGHYNLGHTLFLGGQFAAALTVYEEGQRRDPQQNRRQGCRLAIVRFANLDIQGAERDLQRFTSDATPEEREDLLLEAYEVARALIQARQALAGQQAFLDRIASKLAG